MKVCYIAQRDGSRVYYATGISGRDKKFAEMAFPQGLPNVSPVPDENVWVLNKDFVYVDKYGLVHVAKEGTKIDGASIPRFLWPFVGHPFESDYFCGSVIHDVECRAAKNPSMRLDADNTFSEINAFTGVGSCKGWVLYRGVRTGAFIYRFYPGYPDGGK